MTSAVAKAATRVRRVRQSGARARMLNGERHLRAPLDSKRGSTEIMLIKEIWAPHVS